MSDQKMKKVRKSGTACSAFGCPSRQGDKNRLFFRIPKDPERARAWVIACNRRDLLEKPAIVLYKNNRVCSLHFESRMYTNSLNCRLLPKAIPTIFQHMQPSKRKSSKEKLYEEPSRKVRILSSVKLRSTIRSQKIGEILRQYLSETASTPISSSSNKPSEIQWSHASRPSTSKCNSELGTLEVDTATSPETDPLGSSASTPTSASLSSNIPRKQKLGEKEMELKSRNERTLTLDNFLPEAGAEFIKIQARLSSTKLKGTRFSTEYEQFALGLYLLEPLAYNFFTKLFFLPTKLSLQCMTKKQVYRPGLTNEATFELLKVKVDTFLEQDKHCILCIDEIPLMTNLFYDIGRDEIVGAVDLGNNQKEFVPAHNACVIMARGLYNNWKQPIAYYFTQSSFAAAELRDALEKCIIRLSSVGLIVDAVVSDMGSNFIELASILGITPENPAFTVGDRDVLFFFDTPCLLKATRNNLLENQFQFNGKLTSWSYIKSFYERDKMQVIRRAWKLTDSHISPNDFEKTKVEFAAQVLSYTVAGGMNTYVSLGALPTKAMATVEVIGKFNNLFDILNSSSIKTDAKYGSTFKGDKYQLEYLSESIDFIKSLKVYNKNGEDVTSNIKFLNLWLVTINGIKKLWTKTKAAGFKCLMTRRVNRDCLNDVFSSVRQQGGNCVNPTPIQFRRAFIESFCQHFFHSENISGSGDFNRLLTKFKDLKCNIEAEEAIEDETSSVLTLHDQDYRNMDLLTQNEFTSMCRYLMKKVLTVHECDACLELVTTDDLEGNRLLTYFKAYDEDECVVNAPNELFLQYVYKLEVLFFSKFKEFSTKKGIGLAYFKEMEDINLVHNCPEFPREYLLKLFIRLRIFNSVKFANRKFRSRTSNGSKRNIKISILRLDR